MSGKSNISLEIDHIAEEERRKIVKECRDEIEKTEKILSDPVAIQTVMKKQTLVMALAERYEKLYEYGASAIPTNGIATFLLKRFKELHVSIADSTIYDNLPARFKTHVPNPISEEENITNSDFRSENSSLNADFEAENMYWIGAVTEVIDFLRSFRIKLFNSHFVSLLPEDVRNECNETISNIETITRIAKAVCDDRQSVPVELQHLLVSSFSAQTNNFAAGIYITQIKNFGMNRTKEGMKNLARLAAVSEQMEKEDTLTSKQAVKILLGHVKKVAQIYNPKNRNEALECGYHGTQCTNAECRSWRTFLDLDSSELVCRCHACGTSFERKIASKCKKCCLPFYDEVIQIMKRDAVSIEDAVMKSSCPQCHEEIFLPIKKMMSILVKQK